MNRIAWYFKQPVTFEDMDYADDGTEGYQRSSFVEQELSYGVVTGYTITAGAGLTFVCSGVDCVAYDKAGRRIRPIVFPITQSFATATDGGSTAVASAGNERWVSVFAKGGRKFTDAATDGNGLSVRKTATECLNALGDADHPVGAYDGTAAKEAGVDKFYIAVGVEGAIGTALRPGLLDDAVLLADFHLVNGQTTLTAKDILVDRRQVMKPLWLQIDQANRDLYFQASGASFGVTAESNIFGTTTLHLQVQGGRGYTYRPPLGGQDRGYVRWGFDNLTIHNVPVKASATGRQDLLVVDYYNQLRVLLGTEGSNVPPTATGGQVALAEIQAMPGTTATTDWPVVRRSFRRMPYPYSTMTGIVEGCRLQWIWASGSSYVDIMVRSPKNKIAFNGEVVEFDGGYEDGVLPLTPKYWFLGQDSTANPFGSTAGPVNRPYFIYACRNQFWLGGNEYSPICLLESGNSPDSNTGHPQVDLGGPRGVIPAADAVLIGVGWIRANTNQRMHVTQTDDGWFTPSVASNSTASVQVSPTAGSMQIAATPSTSLCDQVRVQVIAITSSTFGAGVLISLSGHEETNMRSFFTAPVPLGGSTQSLGEVTLSAVGGYVYTELLNPAAVVYLVPSGYHVTLPKVTFGGG
jgi:hypothetical protein